MSPEKNGLDRRMFLKYCGATALALVTYPFVFYRDNTFGLIRALRNGIDCGKGVEALNQRYPYDLIIVPGSYSVKGIDGKFEPDNLGKMRLKAAAIAYFKKIAPTVVLLVSERNHGEDDMTEWRELQEAYQKLIGNNQLIPDGAIILAKPTVNTYTNMAELPAIASRQKGAMITNEFHELRSLFFACNFGVAASPLSAESLLIEQDPSAKAEILALYKKPQIKFAQTKEILELIWYIWDRDSKVTTEARSYWK